MNPALHTELWTSWGSLLRSYAAAHGLNTHLFAIVEFGQDQIMVRYGTRWVRFTQHEQEASDGTVEAFALNEDGTTSIGGKIEEMDMAAERITRELMQ